MFYVLNLIISSTSIETLTSVFLFSWSPGEGVTPSLVWCVW